MIVNFEEYPEITQEDIDRVIQEFQDPPLINNEIIENETLGTVHSTQEDNGKYLPISERPVNVFPNRIIVNSGETYKRRISRPFNRNTHFVTISKNSTE